MLVLKTKSFLILVFMFLGTSFSASASSTLSTNIPPQNSQSFIYISSDAIVSGQEHISVGDNKAIVYVSPNAVISDKSNFLKAQILKVSKTSVTIKKIGVESQVLGVSKEFIAVKIVKDKSIQLLVNRLNEKVKITLYNSTDIFKLYKWLEISSSKLITSGGSCFQNAVITTINSSIHKVISSQIKKQEFYTSLCFLELPKWRNTVLRGPPTI